MQIPLKEKRIAHKEPIWLSVYFRFHDFPGGNDLGVGFSPFSAFLLYLVPTASLCSSPSSRTDFLKKKSLSFMSSTSASLCSHLPMPSNPTHEFPSEARKLSINIGHISGNDSDFIPPFWYSCCLSFGAPRSRP